MATQKEDQKLAFKTRLLLNAGQNYCRMFQGEHSAILSTFIKLLFVCKIFVLSIFEWLLKTVFTVNHFECLEILHDFFLSFADLFFFKINIWEFFSKIPIQCQRVWIQIRPIVLSDLIWIQTVCNVNNQMTPADKRVNKI